MSNGKLNGVSGSVIPEAKSVIPADLSGNPVNTVETVTPAVVGWGLTNAIAFGRSPITASGMTASSAGMTNTVGLSTDDEATLLAAFKLLGLGFGALASSSMMRFLGGEKPATDAEMIIEDAKSAVRAGSPEQEETAAKVWEGIFERLGKLPDGKERDGAEARVLAQWYNATFKTATVLDDPLDTAKPTSEIFRKLTWLVLELNGLLEGKGKPINVIAGPIFSFLREWALTDPNSELTASDRSSMTFEITSLFERLVKATRHKESYLRDTMAQLQEMVRENLSQVSHGPLRDLKILTSLHHTPSELQRAFLLKLAVREVLATPITGERLITHEVNWLEPSGSRLKEITEALLDLEPNTDNNGKKRLEEFVAQSVEEWIERETSGIPDTEATRANMRRLNDIGLRYAKARLETRGSRKAK